MLTVILIYNLIHLFSNMKKVVEKKKVLKIAASTHARLERLGAKGDSFDDILIRLLDEAGK